MPKPCRLWGVLAFGTVCVALRSSLPPLGFAPSSSLRAVTFASPTFSSSRKPATASSSRAVTMSLFTSPELARSLASGAAAMEFAALAVAVPMAITAVSADSNRKALVEKARLEAHNTIVERKRLRDEKAAMQAAEELKKKEAKARLEERIAAAKAEQLRIESNQDAVLNAEKERAAAKAAAIRAAAAAKEGASATRSLT